MKKMETAEKEAHGLVIDNGPGTDLTESTFATRRAISFLLQCHYHERHKESLVSRIAPPPGSRRSLTQGPSASVLSVRLPPVSKLNVQMRHFRCSSSKWSSRWWLHPGSLLMVSETPGG